MINVIIELSKYLILTLMILYTFQCFHMFRYTDEQEKRHLLRKQIMLTFFMNFTAFLNIYLITEDFEVILFYVEMTGLFAAVQILFRIFYKKASLLLINNMCMLLSIGFIMLCRLDMEKANKQLLIVSAACILSLIIPVMIRKMKFLKKLTWVYAGAGILLLTMVLVLAQTTYGAKLSIMGFQPTEVIKITFVFFMAALLWNDASFSQVVKATIIGGLHVLILVFCRDLGSAAVFFITYLVMIYVATKKLRYLAIGFGGGAGASVIAYFLFGHVRQRVVAWKDPMAVYNEEGYQIVQSLFAIGTGGWFGMGLCQGSPKSIPVVTDDFIFSAICEELGGLFAICMILVCMSFFLMIVNISLQIKNPFYKLIALGLGTEYAFQVFLTIGGATKFIPMTGITLPLVSYGGSSVMSTIIMLAIIQGLYILREDEDEEFERLKQETAKRTEKAGEIR
ncbi:cell division protein FtsW [Blautia sp. An249]|uniref:FtsW/RodA/SpoVE family cell cycle protein n=1 Tax=Blautia sp. An249 TaxID=1965603 RepID=UPI000B38FE71|nr:FtsW/RodA/SpoVE family cell cycle protein [Blautia sp. An249]OUO80281.1 cell division protein FtsW [Blautia sp. An249]